MQPLTFVYLATYLLAGGLGLLVVSELTLRLPVPRQTPMLAVSPMSLHRD